MACHLRSISLPSRPHSSEAEVQQELDILEAIISSPSTCIVTMCDGLRRLGDIYSSVEEMIHLPSNQVCFSQQRKMLDGEIESSLELLDLCNTMQEIFVELKAIIQELQMALRKGDDATVQSRIHSYSRLVKKAKQHFKKASKVTSDKTDCAMIMLLTKAREITISLLESTMQLLSKQIEMPKQSLVSKAFYKRKAVVCEEDQLQALECNIGDLESGAGHLFRILVQSRVSLLNILSS
ncbi:hypothetical protein PAHAL_6G297900 [Panicum hallii]|jgi:hypothetical protein|uniref:Uncharacterized protein n=1 Tax=Panicum hallii TaxID=206008 RepID=A0A2T8II60_9POAL|nr:uncharacterized protein LOC112898010 [Panicum hallii]PVH37370.1 hypothetical protein PAHAL_6G297900 [Panicum hallii]